MRDKSRKHWIKFLILVVFFFLFWCAGKCLHIDTTALERSLSGFPLLYSALLYIITYVAVTFFIFFSKDVFWIAGAVVFGAPLSTLFIVIGEVINAFILFHLARYLGRSFVEHYVKEKLGRFDGKLSKINFFWLLAVRGVPLIPYRFLDLGAGLTSIHFRRYILAVLLATPLRVLWVQTILAAVGRNIFGRPELLIAYLLGNKSLFVFTLIYIILIVMVVFKLKRKD